MNLEELPQAGGDVETRYIVCAACYYPETDQLFLGPRHFDATMRAAMRAAQADHLMRTDKEEQGFIDQHGIFVSREEAWEIAKAAGQIRYRCGGDGEKLFSENLY